MSAPLLPQPKRLHRMNRLKDVGPFPGGGLNGSNDQCDGLMLAIPVTPLSCFGTGARLRMAGRLNTLFWIQNLQMKDKPHQLRRLRSANQVPPSSCQG